MIPRAGGARAARIELAVLLVLSSTSIACEPSAAPRRAPRPEPPARAHVEQIDPDALRGEPPPAIADPSPAVVPEPPSVLAPPPIERAPAADAAFDSDETIPVRRYVYRVQLIVPEALGENRSDIAIPAAELFVDVSLDRLRARFVGPGWPVPAGSEVRLRGDSPGVYVFDAEGGRSLAPGSMAEWFEGGPTNRTGPPLVVRRDPQRARAVHDGTVPGNLVCALLAEWSGEPRENVMRRCLGAPLGFRVGLWRGERTAEVPVEIPRRSIRADEVDPPDPVPGATSRAFLDPGALARLPTMERAPSDLEAPEGSPPPAEGLEFVNESEARVLVTVEGVAVGWVSSGARGVFVGMRPGPYRVAALRPLGAVVIRPRIVVVPGTTTLRAPRRRASEGEGE